MKRYLPDDWFPREIPPDLSIGERSYLVSSYAFLHCPTSIPKGIRIGNDTGIYHGTFFEVGQDARVEIGNFSTLVGAFIRAEREITVGDYVFIAHEVTITDCEGYGSSQYQTATYRLPPGNCDPRPVHIGNDVWIGLRAVILAGVTIGEGAVIGAGTIVYQDVPPMTIFSGNPGRILRRIDP
jgi:acetyltransferase-like isoleucine patch superfamily enzyme